ncbi:hypothetical protein NST28_29205 [Paenibacillus sp. FSL R10-2791]|uniref:hypothetical protein n=1 Tax=Paenibacillus sp. FSL R10-2791 TaxID=2954695 RepID=UPI0030F5A829
MEARIMTDQQLNRALAELMGWTVEIGPVTRLWRLMKDGKIKATSGESEELMWSYAPDYSNDSAASLEVQAKALELNYKAYIDHLDEFVNTDELTICSEPSYRAIASLLLASPRERAEASYITLQGAKG